MGNIIITGYLKVIKNNLLKLWFSLVQVILIQENLEKYFDL